MKFSCHLNKNAAVLLELARRQSAAALQGLGSCVFDRAGAVLRMEWQLDLLKRGEKSSFRQVVISESTLGHFAVFKNPIFDSKFRREIMTANCD
jgi:hypothetical protein